MIIVKRSKQWTYTVRDEDAEFLIKGRHADDMDIVAVKRECGISRALNDESGPEGETPDQRAERLRPVLKEENRLMFGEFWDVTQAVMMSRCITSHKVSIDPDDVADFLISDFEQKERTEMMRLIMKPFRKDSETPTPSEEGVGLAENFREDDPKDPGQDS